MKRIAVFASGNGTNAENLIIHFKSSNLVKIELILCNNADAYVLERAKIHGIKSVVFTKSELNLDNSIIDLLDFHNIDFIVLAGFLWLIPSSLITKYPKKIINIHPALLPKYGGKGMYGMHVHESVIEAGEVESGVTIHYVNDKYDEGENIFQARCGINDNDNADSLAKKIHALEHEYFPKIIEQEIIKI